MALIRVMQVQCLFSPMAAGNLDNWPEKGEECVCASHRQG